GVDLARFLLVPLVDGFRLEVESGAPLPVGTELVLSYTVESKKRGRSGRFGPQSRPQGRPPRRPLESMSIGIVGTSFLDSPLSSGMEAFSEDDDAHANSLGEVQASTRPGGTDFAATNLTDPYSEIRILAYLVVGVDGFLSPAGSRSDDDDHDDGYGDEDDYGEFESPGNAGVEMRFSAEPIPEPSSVLLVGFGLAVLSSWTRRRADS
ncbi:MAG TPA: PEP-CTERM sorting domain-containing protein, partial [Myxococcales bacterium]|nr:PEP-CTERM sorting domain-containing protein [Myxococcales bacterium]